MYETILKGYNNKKSISYKQQSVLNGYIFNKTAYDQLSVSSYKLFLSSKWKVAPSPSIDSAQTLPLCL